MNDKEYRKAKKRVESFIDKWEETVGLGWWTVKHHWMRGDHEDDNEIAAETKAYWNYKRVHFFWYLPALFEKEDYILEHLVVHEFAHALMSPLYKQLDGMNSAESQINEYATTQVEIALIWAREAGEKKK